MVKRRVDQLLVELGHFPSLREAQAAVLAGIVLVDEQRIDKPGTAVDESAAVRIKDSRPPYASRGGLKLEAALRQFGVDVRDAVALDLGASTGGFTDCLLQHGARKVYAFDVGRGQLDWKLQRDPRVVVRDGFNVRYLSPEMLHELPRIITVDLAFISLRLILPALALFTDALIIVLFKPQFEAARDQVGPGGVIGDDHVRHQVLEEFKSFAQAQGFKVEQEMESPIEGQKGNREFLLLMQPPPRTPA